jgi:N-methylhydantoinase B
VRSNSPWVLSTMYDRTRCPARGIQGGSPGAAGAVHTVGGEELHPKRQQRIAAEERLILSLPGGGGFGLATERDPDRVARDVRSRFDRTCPRSLRGRPNGDQSARAVHR